MPKQDRDVTTASFDCGGKLDPAAQVICRFPTLARFDGVMARIYVRKLAQDPAEKQRQRAWLALRRAACPSDKIDLSQPNSMLMDGYCMLYLTMARINQMKAE